MVVALTGECRVGRGGRVEEVLDGRVGRGMENGEEGSEVQAGKGRGVLQLHNTNQERGGD